jgi:hypothetical protein
MILEEIFDDLNTKFPTNTKSQYEEFICFEYKINGNTINFEIYNYNNIIATCGETDYTDKLKELIQNCTHLPEHQIPAYVIDIFITDEFDDFIGEELNVENMGNKDYLYRELGNLIKKPERKLNIFSFGEKHQNPNTTKYDKTFDVRKMNSNRVTGLHKLRGTDEIIQKCIESGSEFDKVMTWIVEYIERENPDSIGIYCRAGHHRSVAVVELLKKYVYKNAIIKHLHINAK